MFFQQGALNVIFYFQLSKQTNQKTLVFTVFWQDNTQKKHDVLKQFFTAHAPPFAKRLFFTLLLPPLIIRTQEGVKSGQIAKLHLHSTFCLSQSLPQSCNTKNWGRLSGPQNAVNCDVLWTYHAFYLQKKVPPQLKLTVLMPPERHALLHLRCGRILNGARVAWADSLSLAVPLWGWAVIDWMEQNPGALQDLSASILG